MKELINKYREDHWLVPREWKIAVIDKFHVRCVEILLSIGI